MLTLHADFARGFNGPRVLNTNTVGVEDAGAIKPPGLGPLV